MKFVVILCIVVMATSNRMTADFQSCNLQCSNDNQQYNPILQTSKGSVNVIRGKSGPRGMKGERGHRGMKGEPGVDCNVNEINQLKKQLGNLSDDLTQSRSEANELRTTLQTLTESMRPQNCSEIKKYYPESKTGLYTVYENKLNANGKQVGCNMTNEGSEIKPSTCDEILEYSPSATDGVYKIFIDGSLSSTDVFCNMVDGGWTVFQRRFDGSTDFRRNFAAYKNGFGNINAEYWLGLEKLHQITMTGNWELFIKLVAYDQGEGYAKYSEFSIGSGPGYRLHIGAYSGTAGDSMTERGNGMKFSTEDSDQDDHNSEHCARRYTGSWWFRNCLQSNLNSHIYGDGEARIAMGMMWKTFKGWTSVKETTMMFRKIN